jgi:TonB family protein
MRFAILTSLALLPVLAHAQVAAAPAGTQTLASVSQPKLVRASANTAPTAAPAAIAIAPVSYHDVVHAVVNNDLRAAKYTSSLGYTFYGDNQANDPNVKAPVLIRTVGRTLPLAQVQEASNTDVTVHVIVSPAGVPEFATITRSAGPAIDKGTLAAVREYRFKPATVDLVPVEADLTLNIQLQKQ